MQAARQQMLARAISNAGRTEQWRLPLPAGRLHPQQSKVSAVDSFLTHTVTQPTPPTRAHLIVSSHSLRLRLDSSEGLVCHVIDALQPRTPATPNEAAPVLDAARNRVRQLVQVPAVMQGCHDSIHLEG